MCHGVTSCRGSRDASCPRETHGAPRAVACIRIDIVEAGTVDVVGADSGAGDEGKGEDDAQPSSRQSATARRRTEEHVPNRSFKSRPMSPGLHGNRMLSWCTK